jgi:hypothetical protein
MRLPVLALAIVLLGSAVTGQSPPRPPVIDVHVHSTTTTPKNIARLESLNVRYWVLSGLNADLVDWQCPLILDASFRRSFSRAIVVVLL